MSADFRLGIQSYCFRNFRPLDELVGKLKESDLAYVEIWSGHLAADAPLAEQRKMLETLGANGVTVDAYSMPKLGADEQADRQYFEFARLAGARSLSCDLDPAATELPERLSEEYGISLAIHNHGRNHALGSVEALEDIFSRTSPRVGLCMDTAWMLDSGTDPLDAFEKFKDRLYGVHLKDFTFDAEGKPQDVIVGQGGLDLPEFMRRLNDVDYDGFLSLEYEADPDNPVPAIRKCVQVVREVIAALK